MPRATTLTRLDRLDRLAARLKADEPIVLKDIADELGVSQRTVSRDVRILRERGLPVEADRGRGGGVRLHWSWGVGRLALSYREAVDLLVSLAVAEQMKSPILMANLAPIRRKLAASFSPGDRARIKRLRSRILVGQSASSAVLMGYAPPTGGVAEKLHQAFLTMRTARLRYRDGSGVATERAVEPHYLLLNYPVWYALCWDRLRGEVRTFRCDRMVQVQPGEESFALLPMTAFQAAIDGVEVAQDGFTR